MEREDSNDLIVNYSEFRKKQQTREYKAYGWWSVLWGHLFDENRVYVGNIKVFKLNECDRVAACTLQEAIEWYLVETGLEPGEGVDDPHECPLSTTVKVESDFDDGWFESTYKKQILAHAKKGYRFPIIIASTEY
jgi:hypothetical protein